MSEAAPFSELLAHRAFLRRIARALVHDGHVAEDVAQDTLLRALEARPAALSSPRAWLARVARHGALRWKRREDQRAVREQKAARPESVEERSMRDLTLQQDVFEAVFALDPIYRSAIFLRFYEDRTPSRIAAELCVPVATVKTRLQRGLAHLRAALDHKHGGHRGAWLAPLAWVAAPHGIGASSSVTTLAASALGLVMKKMFVAASVLLTLGVGFWSVGGFHLEGAREPTQATSLPSSNSLRISQEAEGLAAAAAFLSRHVVDRRPQPISTPKPASGEKLEELAPFEERFPFELGKPIPNPAIVVNLSMFQFGGKGLLREIRREGTIDLVNPLRVTLTEEDASRLAELVKPEAMVYITSNMKKNAMKTELVERTPADPEVFQSFEEAQAYCKTKYAGTADGSIRGTETGYYVIMLTPSEETLPFYLARAECNAHAAVLAERLRVMIETGQYRNR